MEKSRNLTQAVELIKSFEGIPDGDPTTISLDPYLCPAGYWTIGWGHVVLDARGKQIKGAKNQALARSVYPNGITMAEADTLLVDDIRPISAGVERSLKVMISDAKFCTLVSFAFNVGLGALKRSTLLRLVNEGAFDLVPGQFLRWTRGGGKVLAGLQRRREAEAKLWKSVTA